MYISYFQLQGPNARLTMNAQNTLHASVKNVKIHVKLIPAVSMQNVRLGIIEHYVFASMALLVIHLRFAKNVS